MKRILSAVVVLALALSGALLLPMSATADTPPSRPAAPTPSSRWGLPLSALSSPTTRPVVTADQGYGGKFGGFLNGNVVNGDGFTSCQNNAPSTNSVVMPSTIRFGEPILMYDYIAIPFTKSNLTGDLRANNAYPYLSAGSLNRSGLDACAPNPTATATGLWCGSTEWGENPRNVSRDIFGINAGQFSPGSDSILFGGGTPAWNAANCPYITQIDFWVCTYPYASAQATCRELTWLAENSFQRVAYPVQDDTKVGCTTKQGGGISQACVYALGVPDPLDVNQVCVGLQVPAWLDFSWILPDIAIYARCLFQPASGFDRSGLVHTAWSAGPLSAATSGITSAVNSFNITASCGVIIPKAATGPMKSFSMDTCDWPPAFATLKTFLVITSLGLFGWWVYGFVTEIIAGVVSRRTPKLIDGDK